MVLGAPAPQSRYGHPSGRCLQPQQTPFLYRPAAPGRSNTRWGLPGHPCTCASASAPPSTVALPGQSPSSAAPQGRPCGPLCPATGHRRRRAALRGPLCTGPRLEHRHALANADGPCQQSWCRGQWPCVLPGPGHTGVPRASAGVGVPIVSERVPSSPLLPSFPCQDTPCPTVIRPSQLQPMHQRIAHQLPSGPGSILGMQSAECMTRNRTYPQPPSDGVCCGCAPEPPE